MPFDFKKAYKELYLPKNGPSIVEVPAAHYLAVRGQGDPNEEGGAYQRAISVLYALAYALKMSYKGDHRIEGFYEYVVPPLEGFWENTGGDKSAFHWTSVIRVPEFIRQEDLDWAVGEVERKKKLDCSAAELLTVEEGLCVQIMHHGPFDSEAASIGVMDAYLEEKGYENEFSAGRLHHEIYLSDARKVPAEKWKTVIRHPIRRKKPEWKVWYGQGFWGREEEEAPDEEVVLNRSFSWGKQTWQALSAYLSPKGLTLDLAVTADPDAVRQFISKWVSYEKDPGAMTKELREQCQREHPLRTDARAKLLCNGRELVEKHGYGTGWFPDSCAWEGWQNEDEARRFLEHYGLDAQRPWSFQRMCFPWEEQPEALETLTLHLEQRRVDLPGPRLSGLEAGKRVEFRHPVTGREHTLTVLEVEKTELSEACFQREDMEYPRCCMAVSYEVAPPLPWEKVVLWDRGQGDRPRKIGGDGPTAVCVSSVGAIVRVPKDGQPLTAVSSIYFQLPEKLEWQIVFREKLLEDKDAELLPG